MQLEEIEVTCYAGYKHNERPVNFICRGRIVHIAEVVDRWYEGHAASSMPSLDYYKVRGDDDAVYILRYNQLFDTWALLVSSGTTD
jgi:hypothetical protein